MEIKDIQFAHDQAERACETCKRRKRKCDKGLPNCSFCTSKGLTCDYSFSTSVKIWDESAHVSPPPSYGVHAQQSKLSSVFFLDYSIFQQAGMVIPNPTIDIPAYVTDLLGGNHELRCTTHTFFDTVHTYLPIVSKKTFYDLLLNPLLQRRADVAFLCLCMKVVSWMPVDADSSPYTPEYAAARRYLTELEAAGVFTLQVLQGRLLISLFEFGHAVHPAAYMSINACAAHALALGLDRQDAPQAAERLSWVEMEERRRVWWAVVILERVVSMGSPGRPLVTKDPTAYDLLPSDDNSWDQGIPTPNYPINSVPDESEVNRGRFARTAHAIHLLTQVVNHISASANFPSQTIREEELIQLNRTLNSLITLCKLESGRTKLRYCNPVSICHSALLMLHGHNLSNLSGDATSQGGRQNGNGKSSHELSWLTMMETCHNVSDTACEAIEGFKVIIAEVSPLILHSTYAAVVELTRMNHLRPHLRNDVALRTLKSALVMKNQRWTIAGAYLQILEAREVMNVY